MDKLDILDILVFIIIPAVGLGALLIGFLLFPNMLDTYP